MRSSSSSLMMPLLILGGMLMLNRSSSAGAASTRALPKALPPQQLRAAWTILQLAPTLQLDTSKQYCATIDMPLPAAAVATLEDVRQGLAARADWESLVVWDDPTRLPDGLPFPAADRVKKPGRYWIFAQPARAQSIASQYVLHIFSRAAKDD